MKAFTALIALASAVNAHMIMKTPTPAGSPDSSPLSADGSNFPCKTGPGKLDTSNPNVMSVGSANTLSFTGSATHGGGSCQISLAKGTDLSADTKWMVIHSIEGGCPAPNNGNQNLGNDPNGNGASQFQFTIPDHPDLSAGDYTLAWTWNNRIGNREFYMNCAYVQLQGAAKKRYAPSKPAVSKRQSASLPDMFVANIGNGCTTAEGIDVEYPNPGASVEIGPGANLGAPSGSCGSTGSAPANPGGNNGGNSPSASAGVSNTVAPVQPSANPGIQPSSSAAGFGGGNPNNGQYTQSNGNGNGNGFATVTGGSSDATGAPGSGQLTQTQPNVFATVTASSASAPAVSATSAAAQQPSAPAASPPSAPEPSATSAPSTPIGTGTPSVPPSTSGQVQSGACSDEGQWACVKGGQAYQRCASGIWSPVMAMAPGTQCQMDGTSNFSLIASGNGAKRDLRSHIARRRHNLHSPSFS